MRLHPGAKHFCRIFGLLLVLVAVIAFNPTVGNSQKKKLSKQDVMDLLTGDVSSEQVADEARKSGISFQVTSAVENDIRGAGGTDELIRVLRSLAPRTSNVPSTPSRPVPSPATTSPPVLMIESNPGQSQVYIDDEPVGSTSQQGRLKLTRIAPGDHRVRISLSGYQDHEETISLTQGGTTTVAATLQQRAAPAPPTYTPTQPPPTQEPQVTSTGQPGYLGVQATQQPAGAHGVVISGITPGGPADQVGMKTYDSILAINGRAVTTAEELRSTLASHQAGEVVRITWYNGSTNVTRQVRLAAAPAQTQTPTRPYTPPTVTNMPHTGFVSFTVAHDHGKSGQDYCVGVMSIGNGLIHYKSTNGVHTFEIPLDAVREARKNAVYLMAIGAFHIRLKKGTNYNFVVLNQQGQYQPPDPILTAIDNAMGR
jgi:hypothetical protein